MNIRIAVAVCFLLTVTLIYADKGGPKRGKGEPSKPNRASPPAPLSRKGKDSSEEKDGSSEERPDNDEGDRYSWSLILNENVSAHESAYVPINHSVIVVKSEDKSLKAANYSKAISVYDFTNSSKVQAIRVRDICYLTDSSKTFQEYVDQLAARNNTNVTLSTTTVPLNGTGPRLSKEEALALFAQNPALARLCRRGRIVRATTDIDTSSDASVVRVSTLDGNVDIYVLPQLPKPTHKGILDVLRGGKGGKGGDHRG